MSKHLFGIVVSHYGTAANNRGETEGNITTLQKLLWKGDVHTTVSAEAIRFAIRMHWQRSKGKEVLNRRWHEEGDKGEHTWEDPTFQEWFNHLDDDVLGFMAAEGGKQKGEKGTALIRRARLEVTRAISLEPFAGDITFNAASVGATPSASRGKNPAPYGTEIHATRYQFGFALTPEELHDKQRSLDVVDAISQLSQVAGNQARFLFDFSPETIALRWTDDFAPRMLYSFQTDEQTNLSMPDLLVRVNAGDIDPSELIIGGSLANTKDGEKLKQLGAFVVPGIKAAAEEAKQRLRKDLSLSEAA